MKSKKKILGMSLSALTISAAITTAAIVPAVAIKTDKQSNTVDENNKTPNNNNGNENVNGNENGDVSTTPTVPENNNNNNNDSNNGTNNNTGSEIDSSKPENKDDVKTITLSDNDVYTPLIHPNAVSVYNSQGLNRYLGTNVFTRSINFTYLKNFSSYSNVDLKYVDGSANFDTGTFQISATPKKGYVFATREASKIINVSLNLYVSKAADASVAQSDSLIGNIDLSANSIIDNSTLNTYLIKLLGVDSSKMVSKATLLNNYVKYRNVNIKYVDNSADFANKTFKLSVTPNTGHTWVDGSSSSKTVTVSLEYATSNVSASEKSANTEVKSVSLPSSWSLNAVASQWVPVNIIGMNTWHDDNGYLKDYAHFADIAKKDIISYYGNAVADVQFLNDDPQGMIRIYDGTASYLWVRVILNPEYGKWADGSTSPYKDIRVNVFASVWDRITNNPDSYYTSSFGNWWFDTAENEKDFTDVALNRSDDVPQRWVSNFLVEVNREFKGKSTQAIHDYMEKKILDDIVPFFPNYNITIKALVSASKNDNPNDTDSTWVYDIYYASKTEVAGNGLPMTYVAKGFAFTRYA